MHGTQKVKNISQYSCAFYCTLFSDYSWLHGICCARKSSTHEMNFLSSGKIIWIFAESVCCIFVIIFRIITAQQIQYNEIKHTTVQWWTKEITPLWFKYPFGSKNWVLNVENNIQLKYIKLCIFDIQLKRSLKKIASKNNFWKFSAVDTSFSRGFRLQ